MTSDGSKCVIVGSNGQDGKLLQRLLLARNCKIIGISRSAISISNATVPFDINCERSVAALIRKELPQAVYYLAAHHVASEVKSDEHSFASYSAYEQAHVLGLLHFLTAIKSYSPTTRLFYASSSLVFDGSIGPLQSETTPVSPVGFYGMTKLQGQLLCKHFRDRFNLHVSAGILFSHESNLRSPTYLSKKLILAAMEIAAGQKKQLTIANLEARNDWGYAANFVDAIDRIIRQDQPDDYVVATGESNTVRRFAELVFSCFNLEASDHVFENKTLESRTTKTRTGDYTKLNVRTGWKPSLTFEAMVKQLVADCINDPTIAFNADSYFDHEKSITNNANSEYQPESLRC